MKSSRFEKYNNVTSKKLLEFIHLCNFLFAPINLDKKVSVELVSDIDAEYSLRIYKNPRYPYRKNPYHDELRYCIKLKNRIIGFIRFYHDFKGVAVTSYKLDNPKYLGLTNKYHALIQK